MRKPSEIPYHDLVCERCGKPGWRADLRHEVEDDPETDLLCRSCREDGKPLEPLSFDKKPKATWFDAHPDNRFPVRFLRRTCNRKLGPVTFDNPTRRKGLKAIPPYVCATYVSLAATCPTGCRFRDNGCFVQTGLTGILMRELDRRADGLDANRVVQLEALAIDLAFRHQGVPQDGARGGRDLRLHIGGDAPTAAGAAALAASAARWRARGGGSVWTYTHAWKSVPRAAWGAFVAALASVETPEDAEAAKGRGYVPAITVKRFPRGRRSFRLRGSPTRWIPCPAETSERTCATCRLCLDRESYLRERDFGIAFAFHGPVDPYSGRDRGDTGRARRRLPVVHTAQV